MRWAPLLHPQALADFKCVLSPIGGCRRAASQGLKSHESSAGRKPQPDPKVGRGSRKQVWDYAGMQGDLPAGPHPGQTGRHSLTVPALLGVWLQWGRKGQPLAHRTPGALGRAGK